MLRVVSGPLKKPRHFRHEALAFFRTGIMKRFPKWVSWYKASALVIPNSNARCALIEQGRLGGAGGAELPIELVSSTEIHWPGALCWQSNRERVWAFVVKEPLLTTCRFYPRTANMKKHSCRVAMLWYLSQQKTVLEWLQRNLSQPKLTVWAPKHSLKHTSKPLCTQLCLPDSSIQHVAL